MCKGPSDCGGPRRCSGDCRAAYQRAVGAVVGLERAEQEAVEYLRRLPAEESDGSTAVVVGVPPAPGVRGVAGGGSADGPVGAGTKRRQHGSGQDQQLCEHLQTELGVPFAVEGRGAEQRFVGVLPNGCHLVVKPYTDDPEPSGVGWAAEVRRGADEDSAPLGWAANEEVTISDRAGITALLREALTGAHGVAVSQFGIGLSAVRR